MAMIPVHPAPGLSELLPGWHVVPQNPIRDASTPVVATVVAKNGGAPVRTRGVGELINASFVVPENPLRRALASPPGSGVPGTHGLGCGSCSGGLYGLGQASSQPGLMGSLASAETSISTWLQAPSALIPSVPNWGLVAGGVVALMLFLPGGGEYQQLRSQHRGYKRLARTFA